MKIYDSYSDALIEFKPQVDNRVSIYVCGPTVYNYIHIGNARPVIFFDTVRRFFEHKGYTVDYVSNITNVDDKIINKAIDENTTEKVISERYTKAFFEDVDRLGSDASYFAPKVTDYITDIIDYINDLIKSNNAYIVDGDVYFDVSSVDTYGKLSNRNLDDLISGSRVAVNEKKRNPQDFNLWKKTDVGIKWDSPFGKGRPGWHTECVVMINKRFGNVIDIHGGGSDLRFPHHENEIAQSMAHDRNSIANVWMHNGRLEFGNKKMSKSIGNVIWVKDYDKDIMAFRLFMLSTHYRSPISYTDENIDVYVKEWDKIKRSYKQIFRVIDIESAFDIEPSTTKEVQDIYNEFISSFENDFNTANGITMIQKLVKYINNLVRNSKDYSKYLETLYVFDILLEIFGLKIDTERLSSIDMKIYKDWLDARKNKDFSKADGLREILVNKGIID